MQSNFDNNLQSYFTDMEHLLGMFKDFVSAEKLPKRLIVFHGIGGVGKSSLLRMFRRHCKSEEIPVALASGDDAKSALDVIMHWMIDLKEEGIKFSLLDKTLESYRAIQAKVEDQAKKSQNRVAEIASKAASKTAETAGGALLGAAIGSVVPGVGVAIGGMLGSAIGGMGAEALADWLHGFLDRSAINLLLDPAKRLTDDFVEDISKTAGKRRMVLLLDTYEQMSTLENWVGEVAQQINPNVLIVIAGRKLPNWNRTWQGWMMNAQVEELKPMTEDIIRQLIHRYYATMRGGEPDSKQVGAIIKFARGLPMVVTSAVQLWVKYGVEDFQSIKAEIVANLVDRLMEGVPSTLTPALEAAAIVRWFDQPILRTVLKQDDVRDVYNELRRFPFVRTRVEGLALHDSVREMIDVNLRVQDSERHYELHERAAVYFEKRLEKVTGEEAERFRLERLYHRVSADEVGGINLFQEAAEEFTRYRLISPLQALMNDIDTYSLEKYSSQLWKEYYHVRLRWLTHWQDNDEKITRSIGEDPKADKKLKAYALCDLGQILVSYKRLDQEHGAQLALSVIQKSLDFDIVDFHVNQNFFSLARIALHEGKWDQYFEYLEKAKRIFEQQGDYYGVAYVYSEMMEVGGPHGAFREYFDAHHKGMAALAQLKLGSVPLKARLIRKWLRVWAFAGHCAHGEKIARESLQTESENRQYISSTFTLRDLGWILGFQDKFDDAIDCFKESLDLCSQLGKSQEINKARVLGLWGVIECRRGNYDVASEYIQRSLMIHKKESYFPGSLLEVQNWSGLISELQEKWLDAIGYYKEYSEWKKYGSNYFVCGSVLGLIRVKHKIQDYTGIPPLLAEAEQLAQQYEYNDHLASLRLTQGHLRTETIEVSKDFDSLSALDYYKRAMICALRYNRFLLDELLSGRPQGTPLRPIIPYCLERGEEGMKILLALRDWWRKGVNDIGTPRPDTISPIPEGIQLLEAEKLARERELGDGSIQKNVIERIEAAL